MHRAEAGADIPDALLETLLGKAAPAATAGTDEGGEPAGKPAEPTFNAIAQQNGTDPDALYKATMQLPDDLGTVSVEQAKDESAKYRRGKAQSSAFDEERTSFANEKLRAMQEFSAIVAAIPKEHVSQELKQQYDAYISQAQHQQDQILLSAVPGWSDTAVKAKDHADMQAFISASYGAPSEFINTPMAAWLKKLILDYTQLRQRIDGIKGKRKEPKGKGSGSVPHHDAGSADKVKALASKGDKIGAIAQLLQG